MSRPNASWDPFRDLAALRERLNRLFEAALVRTELETEGGIGPWSPTADLLESDREYRVAIDLPGVDPARIHARVEGQDLVVEGDRPTEREGLGDRFHRVERAYGPFARRFSLTRAIDPSSVAARYRDGVLLVTVSKREGRPPTSIPVRTD